MIDLKPRSSQGVAMTNDQLDGHYDDDDDDDEIQPDGHERVLLDTKALLVPNSRQANLNLSSRLKISSLQLQLVSII